MRPIFASLVYWLTLQTGSVAAHPHVYVDGGISFVIRDGHVLEALQVTWLYDEFETLYILSALDLSLTPDGTLADADMQTLRLDRQTWPSDFDGSVHPIAESGDIALQWPTTPELEMVEGRLRMTFFRHLTTPLDLSVQQIDVAFYETTYFFAFKITQPPEFLGDINECYGEIVPFDTNEKSEEIRATLRALGREQIPQDRNVGALFADKVIVSCA